MDKDMMKSVDEKNHFDTNNHFSGAKMIQPKPDMIPPMPDKINHFDRADMIQPMPDNNNYFNQQEAEQTAHRGR